MCSSLRPKVCKLTGDPHCFQTTERNPGQFTRQHGPEATRLDLGLHAHPQFEQLAWRNAFQVRYPHARFRGTLTEEYIRSYAWTVTILSRAYVSAHHSSFLHLTVPLIMYFPQANLMHELTIVALSATLLWALWKVIIHFVLPSPLDVLHGPPSKSWLSGEYCDTTLLLKGMLTKLNQGTCATYTIATHGTF